MCGICGVRRFGPEPITEDQITLLLCANQDRGMHATGLAIQQPNGETHVLKQDKPAWEFTTGDEYRAFVDAHLHEDTTIVVGHTRHATKGNPEDIRNDHPLWNGHTAVVHNGMLMNDDALFTRFHLDRIGQVDSDILRAILDNWGFTKDGIKNLKEVSGSCAIAAISTDYPGKLILGRSGSPLVLASTPGQLVWSSEKAAIHTAMRPLEMRFGFPMQPNRTDLAWMTMNDQQIYLIGELRNEEEGNGDPRFMSALEHWEKFNTAHYYNKPTYRPNETFMQPKERYMADNPPRCAFCENCKVWLTIDKRLQSKPMFSLFCNKCKGWLADAPKGFVRNPKAGTEVKPEMVAV